MMGCSGRVFDAWVRHTWRKRERERERADELIMRAKL